MITEKRHYYWLDLIRFISAVLVVMVHVRCEFFMTLKKSKIISTIGIFLLCFLFHFIYDWIPCTLTAIFFPVNESIWEHLKLVFYPIALVSVAEYYLASIRPDNFLCIKIRSIWFCMISTVIIFYTYVGVWGNTVEWLNIVVYFLAMGIAYCFSCKRLIHPEQTQNPPVLCALSFAAVAILFMIFSLYPPSIGIFTVPS